ncbi:hypothetical protein Q3G72_018500 [Acer saccharum]|nr:hypothetical protein Q3G72_018500 [Acer saccharum]
MFPDSESLLVGAENNLMQYPNEIPNSHNRRGSWHGSLRHHLRNSIQITLFVHPFRINSFQTLDEYFVQQEVVTDGYDFPIHPCTMMKVMEGGNQNAFLRNLLYTLVIEELGAHQDAVFDKQYRPSNVVAIKRCFCYKHVDEIEQKTNSFHRISIKLLIIYRAHKEKHVLQLHLMPGLSN